MRKGKSRETTDTNERLVLAMLAITLVACDVWFFLTVAAYQ
jgi:hypothetical protein